MNCECVMAGYCFRHAVDKSDRMVELCQTDPTYWEAWESKKIQNVDIAQPESAKRKKGPGTHLKLLLAEKGYRVKSSGCGCSDKANKMNAWGVARCREKIDDIVVWLEESAKKAGWLEKLAVSIPGVNLVARHEIRKLVNQAIDRAEKSANCPNDPPMWTNEDDTVGTGEDKQERLGDALERTIEDRPTK